ncbi:unnamed protein product [Arctogadus glacialis]
MGHGSSPSLWWLVSFYPLMTPLGSPWVRVGPSDLQGPAVFVMDQPLMATRSREHPSHHEHCSATKGHRPRPREGLAVEEPNHFIIQGSAPRGLERARGSRFGTIYITGMAKMNDFDRDPFVSVIKFSFSCKKSLV